MPEDQPMQRLCEDNGGFLSRRALWGYGIAFTVILLDQWSKGLASAALTYRTPLEITGWFDLMLAHNSGAAFSFLAEAGGWQRWFFAVVALSVSLVMVIWLARLPQHRVWVGIGLGLILGGGLGNLWDRLVLGYVVDFISVHYGDWYWPAFNIADSAIFLGALLLIVDSLRSDEHRPATSDSGEDA